MSKNETSQRITGAEIQSVYSTDENIPGQIPFVSFDEKDLTKFKNEILANRKSNDSSELPEDAESYLKSVIIEARDQPDVAHDPRRPKFMSRRVSRRGNRVGYSIIC